MQETEKFFICPYCGENISMILDLSVSGQSYTEDCEVCCRPIEIGYNVHQGQIESFWAQGTQ